ncbi:hypothetical protein [Methylobacterium nodulans]|uniref:Uncharacterized protein n=1 Tax=Methylobacterium nodulans (strain LMG 21967 / CNCM I-2342 / ORS 2060) TaxID=460265 RepID=B8IBS0_METNO|nr:hypothetical protein [Methylobacterium nodulans]ACL59324.1 conserved hypothetical protein [Methylobacterium nodulans ORS 2060]
MGESGERIAEEQIRKTLDAVLRTPCFTRSPKLASFLRFVVEEELAGRGAALKAYTIATRALGRGGDFDPSLDPSVRVEAGRLRRTLDEAHALAGPGFGVRIRIPVGTYRPHFEMVEPPSPAAEPVVAPAAAEPAMPTHLVVAFSPRGQTAIIALLTGILLMLCIEVGLLLGGTVPVDRGIGRGTSLAESLR